MALSKLTTDMNIVSGLATEPNDVGGLTDDELKAKFDEGPNAIKAYINDTLTTEIDAQKATKAEVQGIVLGKIPDGTITSVKLTTDVTNKIDSKAPATIIGTTAPTTATVGIVGQFYLNTSTGKSYQCKVISGSIYTWEQVGGDKISEVIMYGGTDLGSDYALCNGSALSPVSYPVCTAKMKTSRWGYVWDKTYTYWAKNMIYVPETQLYVMAGYNISTKKPAVMYSSSPYGPWAIKEVSTSVSVYDDDIFVEYFKGTYYLAASTTTDYYPYVFTSTDLSGTWTGTQISVSPQSMTRGIARSANALGILYNVNGYLYVYYTKTAGTSFTQKNLSMHPNGASFFSYVNGYFVALTQVMPSGMNIPYWAYCATIDGTWTTVQSTAAQYQVYGPMRYVNGYYAYPTKHDTNYYTVGYMYGSSLASSISTLTAVFSDSAASYVWDIAYDAIRSKYVVCGLDAANGNYFAGEASSIGGGFDAPRINVGSEPKRILIDTINGEYYIPNQCYVSGRMYFLPSLSNDLIYYYMKVQ